MNAAFRNRADGGVDHLRVGTKTRPEHDMGKAVDATHPSARVYEQPFVYERTYVRVLGIDPGVTRTGYAVVDKADSKLRAVALGVIATDRSETHGRRLAALRESLVELVRLHAPEVAAVERLFFNANVKTAMSVGQASGVALATAAAEGLEVFDYTPLEVKQSVVGHGGASKAQVQAMVAALLRLASPPQPADAADACALAVCHINRAGLRQAIESAHR